MLQTLLLAAMVIAPKPELSFAEVKSKFAYAMPAYLQAYPLRYVRDFTGLRSGFPGRGFYFEKRGQGREQFEKLYKLLITQQGWKRRAYNRRDGFAVFDREFPTGSRTPAVSVTFQVGRLLIDFRAHSRPVLDSKTSDDLVILYVEAHDRPRYQQGIIL
jgi:hypothetical protein